MALLDPRLANPRPKAFKSKSTEEKSGEQQREKLEGPIASMAKGRAHELLHAYLGGSGSLDEDTVEYLLNLVENLDASDEEALQECSAVFVEYQSEVQGADGGDGALEKAARAIEGIVAALQANDGGMDAAAGQSSAEETALIDSMKALLTRVSTFNESQEGEEEAAVEEGSKSNHVSVLRGIIEASASTTGADGKKREVADGTIETILDDCGGDLGEAALWITENDVFTYQAQLARERKDREEAIADSKANNTKIFERYGLRPVSQSSANVALAMSGKKKAGKDKSPKVRYHEGQVVTQRGEKYIVVKDDKEEWDGGSRGKVISKGKRGKGTY